MCVSRECSMWQHQGFLRAGSCEALRHNRLPQPAAGRHRCPATCHPSRPPARTWAESLTKDPSTPKAGCGLIPVIGITETCVQEPVLCGNEHLLSLPATLTSPPALCTQQPKPSCFPCSPHCQAPKFPNQFNPSLSS